MTNTLNRPDAGTQEVALGLVEQIPPGEGREFRVGRRTVTVFRSRQSELYATQSECPHRSAPLADGILGGSTLICPFHGRKFDLTTGRELQGECLLEVYPVRMDATGLLYLTLPDESDVLPFTGQTDIN